MELFCPERLPDTQVAERDPAVFEDMRVLQNLLDLESLYVPSCNYFETIQTDLQPFMRKVVTTWMLEVCDEQACEEQVFPLAVNLVDRFLCLCCVARRQLQLLGAVCLLLASKLRQCHALSVDLLCAYTDHSVSPADMQSWELLVLAKLRWEAAAVTGFDIADHVLARLASAPASLPLRLHPLTRQHALTLVGFCYIEPEFIQSRPSLIAAASICAAVRGLHPGASTHVLTQTMSAVCAATRTDLQAAEGVVRHIERALAAEVANHQQLPQAAPLAGYTPTPGAASQPTASAKMAGVLPEDLAALPEEEDRQPETPIDVQDVHF